VRIAEASVLAFPRGLCSLSTCDFVSSSADLLLSFSDIGADPVCSNIWSSVVPKKFAKVPNREFHRPERSFVVRYIVVLQVLSHLVKREFLRVSDDLSLAELT
jgi:hypothetical protein